MCSSEFINIWQECHKVHHKLILLTSLLFYLFTLTPFNHGPLSQGVILPEDFNTIFQNI